jgi:hypothetical protein
MKGGKKGLLENSETSATRLQCELLQGTRQLSRKLKLENSSASESSVVPSPGQNGKYHRPEREVSLSSGPGNPGPFYSGKKNKKLRQEGARRARKARAKKKNYPTFSATLRRPKANPGRLLLARDRVSWLEPRLSLIPA